MRYTYSFTPERKLPPTKAVVMATVTVRDENGLVIGKHSFTRQPNEQTAYGRRQIADMAEHLIRDYELAGGDIELTTPNASGTIDGTSKQGVRKI